MSSQISMEPEYIICICTPLSRGEPFCAGAQVIKIHCVLSLGSFSVGAVELFLASLNADLRYLLTE